MKNMMSQMDNEQGFTASFANRVMLGDERKTEYQTQQEKEVS